MPVFYLDIGIDMQVIILDTPEQVAEKSAQWVTEVIKQKPAAVLGLATGSTPISLYELLVEQYRHGDLSFADITTFNLDEYHNIAADNPQSYRSFMQKQLFDHVDIAPSRTYLPTCSSEQNPRLQGEAYEQKIKDKGGIDLQILGIGANGHIGFNEPTSSLSSRTRIKTLTKQTLTDNSRLFGQGEFQPTMAMTMGIATILEASYVLLMATGENKASAVKQMVTGPLNAMCPASALQLHQHAVILIDKAAASELTEQDYFLWADKEQQKVTDSHGLLTMC
ncbi:glucosamine-6-phosphate isomerase [Shewanella pealeana ATCC 700345]|uniref:Glucosamine-6-phosphate deaminase n=2 Tax=Shewanella pealeana TaxID=70864 RepID=A8H2Q9_SHEPA|nr:glucosamine-6-phosphate isomerase [Shewanella pealeana ATCC 700345]